MAGLWNLRICIVEGLWETGTVMQWRRCSMGVAPYIAHSCVFELHSLESNRTSANPWQPADPRPATHQSWMEVVSKHCRTPRRHPTLTLQDNCVNEKQTLLAGETNQEAFISFVYKLFWWDTNQPRPGKASHLPSFCTSWLLLKVIHEQSIRDF